MSHKLMPATDNRHTSRMLLSCYGLNGVMQQKVNAEQTRDKRQLLQMWPYRNATEDLQPLARACQQQHSHQDAMWAS
jgi:hypothetical protein